MTICEKLSKILIEGGAWKTILGGLWVTLRISVFALVFGTLLGAFVCFLRMRKNPLPRWMASVYISILRGSPVLLLLLLLYYGVFAKTGIEPVFDPFLRSFRHFCFVGSRRAKKERWNFMSLIEVRGLKKSFGRLDVLKGIDLTVE